MRSILKMKVEIFQLASCKFWFYIFIIIFFLLNCCDKAEDTKRLSLGSIGKQKEIFTSLLSQIFKNNDQSCEQLYVFENNAKQDTNKNNSYITSIFAFEMRKLSQQSSGVRTLTLFSQNVTYKRHEDIHRFAFRHCAFGIFFFTKFTVGANLEPWLFHTIIPRYAPILRKDEDHFIFITSSPKVANVALLSPKFGEKIKYKIALYSNSYLKTQGNTTIVECITVDFYADNGNPMVKVLVQLETSKEIFPIPDNLFLDMTKNFNGKRFRITVPNVKYRFEMEWRDGAYHPKRGFYKWWLDEAIQKFNFTYHMFWSSFGKATGKPLENGSWVGAAGDLLYDRADIAVIVGETYSRQPFFGFSAVLSYEWFFFMTHKPRNFYSPKAIFWPFTPLMWMLFFLSLFIMTLSLKLITEAGTDPKSRNKKWTYSRMFDYIFTTFMEQDRDGPIQTSSIRMLCAFWLLFALVVSTAYRGKLVTLIAFPIDTWIPRTFEELAYSHFKVALNNVGKVGAAYDMLSSSTNPIFQTLFHKMEMIGHPELCLMKAMEEDVGCIIWEGITVYANARNISDKFGYSPMVQSTEIALFIRDGFTYERRAIFKHHMDRTIEAALQMGLTIKWLQLDQEFIRRERLVWETSMNKSEVVYDRYDGPQKLILTQFEGLFILCGCGLLISFCRFLMELKIASKTSHLTQQEVDELVIPAEHDSVTKSKPAKAANIEAVECKGSSCSKSTIIQNT